MVWSGKQSSPRGRCSTPSTLWRRLRCPALRWRRGLACRLHAQDLHPGNILVREPGDATPEEEAQWREQGGPVWRMAARWLPSWLRPRGPPKLVLLDTGMIAELTRADQGHLINFFKALTKQDGERLGRAILDMSELHTCQVWVAAGRGKGQGWRVAPYTWCCPAGVRVGKGGEAVPAGAGGRAQRSRAAGQAALGRAGRAGRGGAVLRSWGRG